jgi:TolB-like protein/Tfp pilus assembly protein PilF
MSFCLDDGSELLFGPASVDEPATAILSEPAAIAGGLTGATDESELKTAILQPPATAGGSDSVRSFDKRLLLAPIALAVIVLGGFFGYRYFSPAKQIESIAVMPFVNESGNADLEYLSDGMTETLISSLSKVPNLSVKARSSVFPYKGKTVDARTVGKELGVQAVLNGRVVQRGGQLTLALELVDVSTENVIWSDKYERKASDLVSLQSEIARDVSSKLKSKLSSTDAASVEKNYTANPEAYQLYLKGRFHWNKRTYDDLLKAIEHFKAAIAIDDRFALAYSGLADSYSVMQYYSGSRSNEFTQQAKPYAIRSVEIDDQSAEAHTSLAFVNEGSWNWAEAEKEYERATELNPNYPPGQLRYARFEVRVPKRDVQGLARSKHALELEPSSLVISDNLSEILLAQGSVDLALDQAKRTVELDPGFSFGWIDLAYAQLKKGQNVEALAAAEKLVEVAKRSNQALICLGFVQAVSGRRVEALAIIKELEEKYQNGKADATHVAAIYVGLGNKDQAFAWLNKAFDDHSSLLVDLRAEFPFASILDDPRYKDLRKRMKMPE